MGVQAGIFHGGKSLCESQKTTLKQVQRVNDKDCNCTFDEKLKFEIEVKYNICFK